MDEDAIRMPWYHPSTWLPYGFLIIVLLPVFIGYGWLLLASFSKGTEGLTPVGGLSLKNWSFLYKDIHPSTNLILVIGKVAFWTVGITVATMLLFMVLKKILPEKRWVSWGFSVQISSFNLSRNFAMATFIVLTLRSLMQLKLGIWSTLLNTFVIALYLTVTVVLVSSMAAYALSRMNFPGRRPFLSMTLVLHGFPAVTLLIPIFYVLKFIGNVPILGEFIGFNKLGGVALVLVAFQLPLGVWLMKGFFDNIPWDTERAALVDGASRFTTWRLILMPIIRPGIFALGIFAFISGWGAFLIPTTYTIGSKTSTLPVYLNTLIDATAPVNWGTVAAVGLFQMIPILLFFFFAQEYLLSVFSGGSKGA